jgi:hypothetical protein
MLCQVQMLFVYVCAHLKRNNVVVQPRKVASGIPPSVAVNVTLYFLQYLLIQLSIYPYILFSCIFVKKTQNNFLNAIWHTAVNRQDILDSRYLHHPPDFFLWPNYNVIYKIISYKTTRKNRTFLEVSVHVYGRPVWKLTKKLDNLLK